MFRIPSLFVSLAIVALAGSVAFAQAPNQSAESAAASDNILHVHLVGLRNSNGQVHCTLFNDANAFPGDDDHALRDTDGPIKDNAGTCDFKSLAPGAYALVVFHDENGNGKFDQNFLGIPQEGYGFSNNAHPRFSAPKFSDCSFDYKGGELTLTIKMIYW